MTSTFNIVDFTFKTTITNTVQKFGFVTTKIFTIWTNSSIQITVTIIFKFFPVFNSLIPCIFQYFFMSLFDFTFRFEMISNNFTVTTNYLARTTSMTRRSTSTTQFYLWNFRNFRDTIYLPNKFIDLCKTVFIKDPCLIYSIPNTIKIIFKCFSVLISFTCYCNLIFL